MELIQYVYMPTGMYVYMEVEKIAVIVPLTLLHSEIGFCLSKMINMKRCFRSNNEADMWASHFYELGGRGFKK